MSAGNTAQADRDHHLTAPPALKEHVLQHNHSSTGLETFKQSFVMITHRDRPQEHPQTEDELDRYEEERLKKHVDHCASRLVILDRNKFRRAWSVFVALLLVYIATIFLFQLCFFELAKPNPVPVGRALEIVDEIINVAFYIDLCINFFFSYYDENGVEVDSLRMIAKNYLCTYFLINVVACLPDQAVVGLMSLGQDAAQADAQAGAHSALRIIRLQRMSRLFRLVRLGRLAKFKALLGKNRTWQWFQSLRGIRIINFLCFLFFTAHILACGWYLCATFHKDINQTWLARRSVGNSEYTLLDLTEIGEGGMQTAFTQWLHSMYFVLTVFTTVGFGDMSAATNGEIIYVILTFLVGAVVHSIIVGEVINVVTRIDEKSQFVTKQRKLIEHFTTHTEVGDDITQALVEWTDVEAQRWMSHQYDKKAMHELITGRYMNRKLMALIPPRLFDGELVTNLFFTRLPETVEMLPPRLPLLFALAAYRCHFEAHEIVYQRDDLATSLFLVTCGTFSHIGLPTPRGGKDVRFQTPAKQIEIAAYPYRLLSRGNFFGEESVMGKPTRPSAVRCEIAGSAICVSKPQLATLNEEFPQFAILWVRTAIQRERHRQECLKRLREAHHFRHFAAKHIQWFWRRVRGDMQRISNDASKRGGEGCTSSRHADNDNWVQIVQRREMTEALTEPHVLFNAPSSSAIFNDVEAATRSTPVHAKSSALSRSLVRAKSSGELTSDMHVLIQEIRCLREDMTTLRGPDMQALRADVDQLRHEVRAAGSVARRCDL